jgi:uncharacterized protein (DUF697 family)
MAVLRDFRICRYIEHNQAAGGSIMDRLPIGVRIVMFLIAYGITIALAKISYRYFEGRVTKVNIAGLFTGHTRDKRGRISSTPAE